MAVLLLAGCQGAKGPGEEKPSTPEGTYADGRGYDPLEFPRDREIIPVKYPNTGSIRGSGALIDADMDPSDSSYHVADSLPIAIDSINNQVFRVQLYTSKQYGEARKAVVVAEEIFDQPVYLDYEVPYYKVRVGNYASRDDADEYQPRVRAAGYRNAWVVVVNLGIREAAPAYDGPEEEEFTDSLPIGTEQEENGPGGN